MNNLPEDARTRKALARFEAISPLLEDGLPRGAQKMLIQGAVSKLYVDEHNRLSPEKTVISSFREGFDFLGFHFGKRHVGVGKKSLKSIYAKVRETTRRNQGDIPVKKVMTELNPKIEGWANYHGHGNNISLFRNLDRWVWNRVRAYIRRRWRDRGRWKLCSAEELDRMGLARMEWKIPRYRQLKLFESPRWGIALGPPDAGKLHVR